MYLKIETVTSSKNCNVAKIGGFYGKKSETIYYIHPDFRISYPFNCFEQIIHHYLKMIPSFKSCLTQTPHVKVKLTSGDRAILEEFSTRC